MRRQDVVRFALLSGAGEVLVALALLPWALSRGGIALGWGLAGWLLTGLAGVGGGGWLVSRHGTPGASFLAALALCMMVRLVLFVAGPFAAASQGGEAVLACVVGLFAGFLPAQAAEVLWFATALRRAEVAG